MRILFVAIACSPHTGRWIDQISDQGWDLHLYHDSRETPSSYLRNVTIHSLVRPLSAPPPDCRYTGFRWPMRRGSTRLAKLLLKTPAYEPAARLAQLIAELQPDVVHTMEMQRCGYVTAEARRRFAPGEFPKWIYSSWGSDLYLYGRREGHMPRIQEVLSGCDYVVTDCERDVGLARQMGFRGEVLGTVPGGGGFHLDSIRRAMQPGPVSSRKTINIKGRHDNALGGRALVALDAVRRCARKLAGYEVVVHYASPAVATEAMALARQTGLEISVLPNQPHEEILRLMGRSRIAIGLGVSDGTPQTMLEAMIAGAFPIQSDTVSTREWISANNGLLVPPEDAETVAAAIVRALEDDQLVNRAAETNAAIADERLERGKIQAKVIGMYQRVMANSAGQPSRVPAKVAHGRGFGG